MEIRMKKKWYFKFNYLKTGFIVGLILPIIGFFIGFLAKGGDSSFSTFWQIFTQNPELVHNSALKSIYQDTRESTLMFCLLANMLAFYFSFFMLTYVFYSIFFVRSVICVKERGNWYFSRSSTSNCS